MTRCAVATTLLALTALTGGCRSGTGEPSGSRPAPTARLHVPHHTGARAGNVPAHVVRVDVDGQRSHAATGNLTIDLPPGPHEVVVSYERCFHGPSQLPAARDNRGLDFLRGQVRFDAEPGANYVLGCHPGGGGAMLANAHWVDQKLAGGRRRRVADTSAGGDFPQELLGPNPPEPMRSPPPPLLPRRP